MAEKINFDFVGVDGNAFSVMAAFSKAAKKQGWTKQEVEEVLDEAMKGDYNHLLQTLLKNTTETAPEHFGSEEDEDDWDCDTDADGEAEDWEDWEDE